MSSNDEGVHQMNSAHSSITPSSPSESTPRRRSSLFSGLENLKRPTSSGDVTRRASMSDQHPKGNVWTGLWNSWVRGTPSK